MNELERRKVFAKSDRSLTGVKLKIEPITIIPIVEFGVFNTETNELLARSFSDHSLSNWAFNHGAEELELRYNLALGDDNR